MLRDGRIRMHNIIGVTIEIVICISINHLIGGYYEKRNQLRLQRGKRITEESVEK